MSEEITLDQLHACLGQSIDAACKSLSRPLVDGGTGARVSEAMLSDAVKKLTEWGAWPKSTSPGELAAARANMPVKGAHVQRALTETAAQREARSQDRVAAGLPPLLRCVPAPVHNYRCH